jgi:threonine/homoserine/homoserine lactone efflux protein
MLSALAYCFLLAGLVAWGKRFIRPGLFRWVNVVCGIFLAFFGLQLIWNTLRSLG